MNCGISSTADTFQKSQVGGRYMWQVYKQHNAYKTCELNLK